MYYLTYIYEKHDIIESCINEDLVKNLNNFSIRLSQSNNIYIYKYQIFGDCVFLSYVQSAYVDYVYKKFYHNNDNNDNNYSSEQTSVYKLIEYIYMINQYMLLI